MNFENMQYAIFVVPVRKSAARNYAHIEKSMTNFKNRHQWDLPIKGLHIQLQSEIDCMRKPFRQLLPRFTISPAKIDVPNETMVEKPNGQKINLSLENFRLVSKNRLDTYSISLYAQDLYISYPIHGSCDQKQHQ